MQCCIEEFPYGISCKLGLVTQPRAGDAIRSSIMKHLEKITQAVLSAEQLVLDERGPAKLASLLLDAGWIDECFSRELMFLLRSCDFDIEKDSEVRKLLWRFCSGTNTTQSILESTFAHLRDIAQRHSKVLKMSPFSIWLYATSSPYAKESQSGMKQVIPTSRAWLQFAQHYGKQGPLGTIFNRLFKLDTTVLPTGDQLRMPVTSAGIVKTRWRNAGPMSHHKASAATALLAYDYPNGFVNVSTAWAAAVLCRNSIFFNSEQKSFWMSFGFMVWCSLGIQLEVHVRGNKDGFLFNIL